jgi:cation diffusion facilitator CzcD-associated flavoprotein CzcO
MANKRAIVLGAGMAGILAAIKLKQADGVDVVVYEKADRVGGTWRENTYPGLTCDTPSHHYTYSFARNPTWSRYLPPGPEIQHYFSGIAEQYGVYSITHFNEEAVSAVYDNGRWHLEFASGRTDSGEILIAATGVLHHPNIPSIEGAETFQGALFHSSRWDHSIALADKRIGIIGSGSTGVQITSALAGGVAHLEHYQRTAQWIMPVDNTPYTEEQIESFHDPKVLEEAMDFEGYSAAVNAYTEALLDSESEMAQQMAGACLMNLEESVKDPELKERLRPNHKAMCKRLIFSPDYYQAIQRPNTALVTSAIKRIVPEGIETEDGEVHQLDIIVFATGFKADRFVRPMTVRGRGGRDLNELWADYPKAYLALSVPDFPNFYMLNGPNGPVGNFSLVEIAENQWKWVEQLLAPVLAGEASEVCCTQEAMEAYEASREAAAKTTVWATGGCNSWYLNSAGIPASWPWNYKEFERRMATPVWDDLDVR